MFSFFMLLQSDKILTAEFLSAAVFPVSGGRKTGSVKSEETAGRRWKESKVSELYNQSAVGRECQLKSYLSVILTITKLIE